MDIDEINDTSKSKSHAAALSGPELQQDLDPYLSDDPTSKGTGSELDDEANPLGDLSYQEFDEYVPYLDPATGEIEMKCHNMRT